MRKIFEHADAVGVVFTILITVFGAGLWMNAQFNQVNEHMNTKFAALEKDMAIIKTVLIMKEIMPNELAKGE